MSYFWNSHKETFLTFAVKANQIKQFFLSAVHLLQGRKLLLLTGPSGCGKTATVRILAREAGLNLLEWTNPTTTPYNNTFMERGQALWSFI